MHITHAREANAREANAREANARTHASTHTHTKGAASHRGSQVTIQGVSLAPCTTRAPNCRSA